MTVKKKIKIVKASIGNGGGGPKPPKALRGSVRKKNNVVVKRHTLKGKLNHA